jgi:hypothetical protein
MKHGGTREQNERQIVWQVVAPTARTPRAVEACLQAAGFAVLRSGPVPPDVRLGTVRPAFDLTDAELRVLH